MARWPYTLFLKCIRCGAGSNYFIFQLSTVATISVSTTSWNLCNLYCNSHVTDLWKNPNFNFNVYSIKHGKENHWPFFVCYKTVSRLIWNSETASSLWKTVRTLEKCPATKQCYRCTRSDSIPYFDPSKFCYLCTNILAFKNSIWRTTAISSPYSLRCCNLH